MAKAKQTKTWESTLTSWYKTNIKSRTWLAQFALPLVFYFVLLCLMTWPWITHFQHFFMTDNGDGFQNVWNMWWVNKAVTQLHQSPWHTDLLHYPYGVTLIAQTLNPFNGFIGILLLKIMSLNQAYNVMVIFSFIFGGLSTFWLCYFFTKRYIPSLIGGFIFTFSSYHFAHAIGHMQLVSLEWIPLFILLWWKFVTKPRYRLAVAASVVLLLVLLCDYYYFLYCVSVAVLIVIYLWRKKELAKFNKPSNYKPLIVFVVLSLIIVAPLPIALFHENMIDPLQGGHPDRLFSIDLFSTIIDGGFWRFASWTMWYWKHIKTYIAESSVYFGLSVITLLIIGLWKRNKIHRDMLFWIVTGLIFAILSLGPRLEVVGYSINHAPLPYAILEKLIPQLKLSGDPDRFIVITFLAAAIISAMVLSKINLHKRMGQVLLAGFCLLLFFEYLPGTLPATPTTQPNYAIALKNLPSSSGVLDDAAVSESQQLYHQIEFDKPMVLGYISRVPLSVQNKDVALVNSISATNYASLCQVYHTRYLTEPAFRHLNLKYPIVYRDSQDVIYDLKTSSAC